MRSDRQRYDLVKVRLLCEPLVPHHRSGDPLRRFDVCPLVAGRAHSVSQGLEQCA